MALNRGRLLLQGLAEGRPMYSSHTYRGQMLLLGLWLFLIIGASLLAYFSWDVPMAGSVTLERFFLASLILWLLIFLTISVPLEIDGIWERGVSGRGLLFARLMSRSFLDYERIGLIRIDNMKRGAYRWKRLTIKDHRNKISLYFGDHEHTNGFYQEILGTLEKMCPGARWMERCVFITKWDREVTRRPPSD